MSGARVWMPGPAPVARNQPWWHLTQATDIKRRGAEVVDMKLEIVVVPAAGGVFHHAGTEGRVAGPALDHKSYGSFASFSDPDGNGWLLQEITTRLPGR